MFITAVCVLFLINLRLERHNKFEVRGQAWGVYALNSLGRSRLYGDVLLRPLCSVIWGNFEGVIE